MLEALLRDLGNKIPYLDAQRAGAELYGAPRLNAFELFKPNENTLSRVVGELFDPRGSHGQGALFVNALLTQIALPRITTGEAVRVSRGVLTAGRRRIDLVIETAALLVGIENKPWAGQQENQLGDYYKELEQRAAGHIWPLSSISSPVALSAGLWAIACTGTSKALGITRCPPPGPDKSQIC